MPAALLAALALPPGTTKPAETARVLYEKETPYQYARVVEDADGTRKLELNEGQAIHSLWRPGTVLTGGYWDGFLVLPFATGIGTAAGADRRAGHGGRDGPAGVRALLPGHADRRRRHRPGAVQDRAPLLRAGARGRSCASSPQDARPFLRETNERYDSIFVDAYRQPYIPFYLTTQEFFSLVRDRLRPGGSVIINIGHPRDSQELEKAMSATLGKVFAHVARDPIQHPELARDRLRRAALSAEALRDAPLPPELRRWRAQSAGRLAPALRGGTVFTDDRAPVEWLIDASIV